MIRAAVFGAALALLPGLLAADARLTRLLDLLELDAYIEITRSEGLAEAGPLSEDMLGRPPSTSFLQQMQRIYDPARLSETVRAEIDDALDAQEVTGALAFFDNERGARIIELELAARQAMSDDTIEEAARAAWQTAQEDDPWLVARINEMISDTNLIDHNVAGALNSNLRFYQGLSEGGGLEMDGNEILGIVRGQEAEIRTDTTEWLGAYFLLAYQPLSQGDILAYLDFWRSDVGQALNEALFAGFNPLYDTISYATGRVLSLGMVAQEL